MDKVFHRLKISPNAWLDLDNYTTNGNTSHRDCDMPIGCVVFSSRLRYVIVPSYYLWCNEEMIGPFRDYEDVLSELEYRNDPINYISGREWIVVRNPSLYSWQWAQIHKPS